MKTRLAFVLFFCGLLAAQGLFVAGCKKKEVKGEPVKTINVQLEPAQKRSLRPYIEAIGTLDPSEEVTISAEIEGIVREVRVSEGSAVSKGMVLAVIDDIDLSLEQKRAQASLKQVQATLANTEVEYKRKEALVKEELVTKQAFEDVATRLALADAEVDRAKAALSLANQKLAKTKIYAPLSCFVKEKRISPGDYVKNGTPLFVIIQSNPIKLHFTVPERDVGKIRVRQEVTLKVQAFPDRDFKGTVNIIYPNLEEKTRTLKVEALVPNGDGLLKPGLFAKVILYTGEAKDMVVAPITSLLYEAEKVRVFVIEGDQAKEKPVKLGNKYGEVVEIVEGLSEGEKVVTAGQQNLSEGARVRVQTPEQQPPKPAAAPPAKDAGKPPAKG